MLRTWPSSPNHSIKFGSLVLLHTVWIIRGYYNSGSDQHLLAYGSHSSRARDKEERGGRLKLFFDFIVCTLASSIVIKQMLRRSEPDPEAKINNIFALTTTSIPFCLIFFSAPLRLIGLNNFQ